MPWKEVSKGSGEVAGGVSGEFWGSFEGYIGCGPLPVTVTTRIIDIFSVGNPYKPSFTTVTGWGPHPRDT